MIYCSIGSESKCEDLSVDLIIIKVLDDSKTNSWYNHSTSIHLCLMGSSLCPLIDSKYCGDLWRVREKNCLMLYWCQENSYSSSSE